MRWNGELLRPGQLLDVVGGLDEQFGDPACVGRTERLAVAVLDSDEASDRGVGELHTLTADDDPAGACDRKIKLPAPAAVALIEFPVEDALDPGRCLDVAEAFGVPLVLLGILPGLGDEGFVIGRQSVPGLHLGEIVELSRGEYLE